jgi:hypothetical protein
MLRSVLGGWVFNRFPHYRETLSLQLLRSSCWVFNRFRIYRETLSRLKKNQLRTHSAKFWGVVGVMGRQDRDAVRPCRGSTTAQIDPLRSGTSTCAA